MALTIQPNGFQVYEHTLVVPLLWFELAPTLAFRDETFYRQVDFHMTLLSGRRYIPLLAEAQGFSEEEARNHLVAAYQKLAPGWKPGAVTPTGELRYTVEEPKHTLVAMVEYGGLDDIVRELSDAIGLALEPPPTHITIYTNQQGEHGLALINQQDLDEKTELIEGDELVSLKSAIRFDEVFGA